MIHWTPFVARLVNKMDEYSCMYSIARMLPIASVTSYYKPGGLNNKNLLSYISGS